MDTSAGGEDRRSAGGEDRRKDMLRKVWSVNQGCWSRSEPRFLAGAGQRNFYPAPAPSPSVQYFKYFLFTWPKYDYDYNLDHEDYDNYENDEYDDDDDDNPGVKVGN